MTVDKDAKVSAFQVVSETKIKKKNYLSGKSIHFDCSRGLHILVGYAFAGAYSMKAMKLS